MKIIKREFIYREKTGLEPAQFKTYINKRIKELRAREDTYRVSGTVTEDFSKCTLRYTIIVPNPEVTFDVNDEEIEIEPSIEQEVYNQLG